MKKCSYKLWICSTNVVYQWYAAIVELVSQWTLWYLPGHHSAVDCQPSPYLLPWNIFTIAFWVLVKRCLHRNNTFIIIPPLVFLLAVSQENQGHYSADDSQLVSDASPRQLHTSDSLMCAVWMCAVQRTWNTYGDRCFAVTGPRVWNSLTTQPRHLYHEAKFGCNGCNGLGCYSLVT